MCSGHVQNLLPAGALSFAFFAKGGRLQGETSKLVGLSFRCPPFPKPGKDGASTSMAAQLYPKTLVIPNRFSGEESAGPMRTAGSSLFRFARRLGMTDFRVDLETNTFAQWNVGGRAASYGRVERWYLSAQLKPCLPASAVRQRGVDSALWVPYLANRHCELYNLIDGVKLYPIPA